MTDIKALIKKGGGVTAIAKHIGRSKSTVSLWKRIPSNHVLDIEKMGKLTRHEMRPDLYPVVEDKAA